jgi:hypothetical protein
MANVRVSDPTKGADKHCYEISVYQLANFRIADNRKLGSYVATMRMAVSLASVFSVRKLAPSIDILESGTTSSKMDGREVKWNRDIKRSDKLATAPSYRKFSINIRSDS